MRQGSDFGFGLRIYFGFRPSDFGFGPGCVTFGFRIWALGFSGCAGLCLFLVPLVLLADVVVASQPTVVLDKPALSRDDALVRAIVTSEETFLVLTRKLNALSKGLLDLRPPGPAADAANVLRPR